ncbi:glycoside hydrolase family 25 [Segniliparus rotundus DSM 44985]|uniref:Glycoside hydrolase family 25 n=2 Tax=Segniliparus rotundus TaxID=286802 RepID=D6ZE51_SEGRD|nr:glycoside hydrolase family 25 [Segniliparus rotundus DSM 44985]
MANQFGPRGGQVPRKARGTSPRKKGTLMTLWGIDISNYQGDIDLDQVAREQFSFVFAKISEGTYFRDSWWPRNRDKGREAGLVVAGYHFLTNENADAQADLVASWLGDLSVPVALDVEATSRSSAKPAIADVKAVKSALEQRGCAVPVIYLPRWYWQGHLGSPDISWIEGLWSSQYPSSQQFYASSIYGSIPPVGFEPYGPGCPKPAIWQFTDRARVAGRQVDADAFLGSRDDLLALLEKAG